MKNLTQHHRPVIALVIADALFFTMTDPTKVSAAWLAIAFGLLIATLYMIITYILRFLRLYGIRLGKRERRLALFITATISSLAALQSVGGLNNHDIFVLVPLAVLLYAYVSYGRPKPEAAKGQ